RHYQQLLDDGVVIEPYVAPVPSTTELIADLEAQVTPRRMREAVLGTDAGWLATKEAEIAALRAML
ncbi:hypothetical protein N9937_02240, partial [bacterium]|nr:hypothetical protein [bacterium]